MDLWYTEPQTKNLSISLRLKESLFRGKSDYQDVLVAETYQFGRALFLDNTVQTTEGDEFTYHEMMAHVPLHVHPNPKRVLIIGGGDGGTLREVVKHRSVEEAVLVDIDAMVMEVSRRFLPTLAVGLDHPRAKVLAADGIAYVKEHENAFDVILIDSTDPVGPAVGLFSPEFYQAVHRALTPNGIMVAQSESPFVNQSVIRMVQSGTKQHFAKVALYLGPVPTYPTGSWSYTFASKGLDPLDVRENVALEGTTRFYSTAVHKAAFALPPFVQAITEDAK